MRKALAGLGVALLLVAGAVAQVRETVRDKDATRTTTKVRRVTALMGGEVRLRSGILGKVADIVIDEDGCIDYLIVRDGEELVAVPWGGDPLRGGREDDHRHLRCHPR
jgi:hypothetical protein